MTSRSTSAHTVVVRDEIVHCYVFDTDVVVEGRRECRDGPLDDAPAIADETRVCSMPDTRAYVDDAGALRLRRAWEEPSMRRHGAVVTVARRCREVVVAGDLDHAWAVLRYADGTHTVADVVAQLPPDARRPGRRLVAALVAAGILDTSGRTVGRFLHTMTKKGVLPGSDLDLQDVLRLVTDGEYRRYPDGAQLPLTSAVPAALQSFRDLTRQRRSCRQYTGESVSRGDLEAILTTACGVTGALGWNGREVALRAYPSSGGLYAAEIYPVVLAVDGLANGVYHYRPANDVLAVVRPQLTRQAVVDVALPAERTMVGGAAALLCITGVFRRHEHKYGPGGYRMLVAEAGHISQNLILAATALGLDARPFGGVYDALLNDLLGLDGRADGSDPGDDEQFLLAVLLGRATDHPRNGYGRTRNGGR